VIVTTTTFEQVFSGDFDEFIVAVTTEQDVVAELPGKQVPARLTKNQIITKTANQDIPMIFTGNAIGVTVDIKRKRISNLLT